MLQRMGVVLHNETYNVNHDTLFPLHPPLMNLEWQRAPAVCERRTTPFLGMSRTQYIPFYENNNRTTLIAKAYDFNWGVSSLDVP